METFFKWEFWVLFFTFILIKLWVNRNFYYILRPTFLVKHMILRKGTLSHTNICFIPTCLETAKGKSTSGLQTRCGPWVCLAYLRPQTESAFKISQTRAEVCASGFSENKVWSPLSPFCCSVCMWRPPLLYGACVRRFASLTWLFHLGHQLFLHKHLSFQFSIYSLFW